MKQRLDFMKKSTLQKCLDASFYQFCASIDKVLIVGEGLGNTLQFDGVSISSWALLIYSVIMRQFVYVILIANCHVSL